MSNIKATALQMYEDGVSKRAISVELGVPRSTVQDWVRSVGIEDHKVYTVPISEDEAKYKPDWTSQDCINELRRIAQIDTEKVITRNYFRNHSTISESTWNRHFGTFHQFKCDAGITLSRQSHQLEKQIAKHASIDGHRKMSEERQSYAENYIRPSNKRFKTVVVCSDLHDIECDPFYLEVLIDTCKRIQPEVIVFNGDIFDLPEFSRYTVDPREWDVVGRIKFVHENIFAPIRKACPDSQLDFVEGNHELRLLKHLSDATPALKVVLADLHGFTISKLFGLDKFQINYIAKGDMSAFLKSDVNKEVSKNYQVYFDSFMCHHYPEGRALGLPGVNGHHHREEIHTLYNETFKSYQWCQSGGGHRKNATYCQGEKWSLGFVLAHVDTEKRKTIFETITVDDFAVVGGKYYFRDKGVLPW